jgi:hypothetical protein
MSKLYSASYGDLHVGAGLRRSLSQVNQQGDRGANVNLVEFPRVPEGFVLVRPALFKQVAQTGLEVLPVDREIYLELSPGLRVIYAVRKPVFHQPVGHALAAFNKVRVWFKGCFHGRKAKRAAVQSQPQPNT